jgi:hypothetical protein
VNRERKVLAIGKDHTDMLPIFRLLVEKAGAKKGDALIWAGCEGACYAMATFFSYFLNDLGINLYFATDGDINRLWRLELREGVGMIATTKENPIKAEVIVLMSGLANVPFDNVLDLIQKGLADGGVIIGETVIPGLFEGLKWHEQIPLRYLFEFSMERPTALELEEGDREKKDEN